MDDLNNEGWPELLTPRLMREVKCASGLSHSELASALSFYADLPDTMISHYLNGRKMMSLSRLQAVARAAKKLGWAGETINFLCYLSEGLPAVEYSEYKQFLRESKKLTKRDRATAVANLEKAVAGLIGEGWSDTEIVTMAALFTEKLLPEHVLEGGGLVHFAALHRLAGLDDSGVAPIAWSAWHARRVDVDAQGAESGIPE